MDPAPSGESAARASARMVVDIGQKYGYDIFGAMEEKLEYNKTRADHDRANRAATGGKKY
jgi:hypothetical protein